MNGLLARLHRFNWALFLSMVALLVVGVFFIYSASSWRAVAAVRHAYLAHAEIAIVGLFIYLGLAFTDYRKILNFGSIPAYVIAVFLLILVLIVGSTVYGGKRWLWFFQPSEVGKLATILMLATAFGTGGFMMGDDDGRHAGFGLRLARLGAGLVLFGVPSLLILKEPDLGTAMVLVPTGMAMMLASRVCTKVVVMMLLAGVVVAAAILGTVYYAESQPEENRAKIIARTHLKPHQIKRLRTFLFPDKDIHGAGYNRHQAEISVGSGGLTGKGWTKGEQYQLGYLPQSVSMNDFIFAVLAEEAGFVGSALVLGLYLVMLLAGLKIGICCRDDGGRLLVVGVMTLMFCHVYVNIAMNIGLMPITGLPLPFISSGRTFTVVMMAALGIVQSVALHGDEPDAQNGRK